MTAIYWSNVKTKRPPCRHGGISLDIACWHLCSLLKCTSMPLVRQKRSKITLRWSEKRKRKSFFTSEIHWKMNQRARQHPRVLWSSRMVSQTRERWHCNAMETWEGAEITARHWRVALLFLGLASSNLSSLKRLGRDQPPSGRTLRRQSLHCFGNVHTNNTLQRSSKGKTGVEIQGTWWSSWMSEALVPGLFCGINSPDGLASLLPETPEKAFGSVFVGFLRLLDLFPLPSLRFRQVTLSRPGQPASSGRESNFFSIAEAASPLSHRGAS